MCALVLICDVHVMFSLISDISPIVLRCEDVETVFPTKPRFRTKSLRSGTRSEALPGLSLR